MSASQPRSSESFTLGSLVPALCLTLVFLLAVSFLPSGAFAAEGEEDVATLIVDAAVIRFVPKVHAERFVLQVTGIEGVVFRGEISAGDGSVLSIPLIGADALQPGHYTYKLSAVHASGEGSNVQTGGFLIEEDGVTLASAASQPAIGCAEIFGTRPRTVQQVRRSIS